MYLHSTYLGFDHHLLGEVASKAMKSRFQRLQTSTVTSFGLREKNFAAFSRYEVCASRKKNEEYSVHEVKVCGRMGGAPAT